jgi:cytoskeletal protein CcmA (bactofilin family)
MRELGKHATLGTMYSCDGSKNHIWNMSAIHIENDAFFMGNVNCSHLTVKGNVYCNGSIYATESINVKGSITCKGSIYSGGIMATGKIIADKSIKADDCIINGGAIIAGQHIESPTILTKGDLTVFGSLQSSYQTDIGGELCAKDINVHNLWVKNGLTFSNIEIIKPDYTLFAKEDFYNDAGEWIDLKRKDAGLFIEEGLVDGYNINEDFLKKLNLTPLNDKVMFP